jgi:hypothetical protein
VNPEDLDPAALRAQAEVFERMASNLRSQTEMVELAVVTAALGEVTDGSGKRGLDLLAALDPVAALAFFDQLYGRIVALAVQIDMRR